MEPFAPHRVLAAIDFSDLSALTLHHAALWAQRFRAELRVLHAFDYPPLTGDPRPGTFMRVDPSMIELHFQTRETIRKQLAEYVPLHVPVDLPATPVLREGYPADIIEAEARTWGAELVVLGTHGRRGLSRLILGSVAERTLRMARHPTLVVRQISSPGASDAEPPCIRQILCPVNYSEVARAAFEHAVAVAQAFAARLTAVFAVEEEHSTSDTLRNAEERLREWLPAGSDAKCWIQAMVRHGDAAEQVISMAHVLAADLIVIGAQHRHFVDTTVLGVTTVRVTRHAPCPVLVVPRAKET
jgi:nucleotide-binding universal stress UspA family protein